MSDDEYYKLLNERILNQTNTLDKSLLTLSSAAIGLLTATLIPNSTNGKMALTISLLLFTLSIISTLLSHFFSILANEEAIKLDNKRIESNNEHQGENLYTPFVAPLTYASLFMFIIGVLSILYVYSYNLIRDGNYMSDKKTDRLSMVIKNLPQNGVKPPERSSSPSEKPSTPKTDNPGSKK